MKCNQDLEEQVNLLVICIMALNRIYYVVERGWGNGYPLSGVIGKSAVMDLPEIGNMSSTHSANPLACSWTCSD